MTAGLEMLAGRFGFARMARSGNSPASTGLLLEPRRHRIAAGTTLPHHLGESARTGLITFAVAIAVLTASCDATICRQKIAVGIYQLLKSFAAVGGPRWNTCPPKNS